MCAIQMDIEQIQEREQLLTAENVLLKVSFISYQILSFKLTKRPNTFLLCRVKLYLVT